MSATRDCIPRTGIETGIETNDFKYLKNYEFIYKKKKNWVGVTVPAS